MINRIHRIPTYTASISLPRETERLLNKQCVLEDRCRSHVGCSAFRLYHFLLCEREDIYELIIRRYRLDLSRFCSRRRFGRKRSNQNCVSISISLANLGERAFDYFNELFHIGHTRASHIMCDAIELYCFLYNLGVVKPYGKCGVILVINNVRMIIK